MTSTEHLQSSEHSLLAPVQQNTGYLELLTIFFGFQFDESAFGLELFKGCAKDSATHFDYNIVIDGSLFIINSCQVEMPLMESCLQDVQVHSFEGFLEPVLSFSGASDSINLQLLRDHIDLVLNFSSLCLKLVYHHYYFRPLFPCLVLGPLFEGCA